MYSRSAVHGPAVSTGPVDVCKPTESRFEASEMTSMPNPRNRMITETLRRPALRLIGRARDSCGPPNRALLAEDGSTYLLTEDGKTYLTQG
jgi:hypothetical protein